MSKSNTQGKAGIGTVILLGILAVLALLFFRGMSQADDAKNIGAVLKENQQFGEILASRLRERADLKGERSEEDLARMAGYFDEFLAQLRKIDTHACPRDFAEAFYRYYSAVEDQAQAVHAYPHIPSRDQLLAASLQDEIEGNSGKHARELKADLDEWDRKQREKGDRAAQAEENMKAIATHYGAL